MKRVLVIGASGFLASELCRQLGAKSDIELHGICRDARDSNTKIDHLHSVQDLHSLDDSFEQVYLLAAHIPYEDFSVFSDDLIESNITLVRSIVKSFPSARLVFSSSVSVYGIPVYMPIDEKHPFNLPNAYAVSKIAGENIVASNPKHIILRFSSVYGLKMRAPTFLPTVLEAALSKRCIKLRGDGKRTQDYLNVRDAANKLVVAANSESSGVYNAVSGRAIENREVAETVSELLGGVDIIYEGKDESHSFQYSNDRWNSYFGPTQTLSLKAGLKTMISEDL